MANQHPITPALRAAQSRVVTITLNEDELVELKEQLGGIYELWDSSGEELRECYASSVIGKLWSILSPAAQVVIDAWWNAADGKYIEGVWTPNRSAQLAAALEAVADQVVPCEKAPDLMRSPDLERLAQRQRTRAQLLAIAAELRGTNPTNQEDNTTTQEDNND